MVGPFAWTPSWKEVRRWTRRVGCGSRLYSSLGRVLGLGFSWLRGFKEGVKQSNSGHKTFECGGFVQTKHQYADAKL